MTPDSEKPAGRAKTYATMDDVAALAGVHPTTVSMALRSHPSIPAATRERILESARKIGYVRDPLLDAFNHHRLKKLAVKQTPSIAFVIDAGSSAYFFGSGYHPLVYEGVRAVAEAQHLLLEVFALGTKEMTAARLNTILSSRGINGVLLSTFTPSTTSIELDWDQYSAVKIESHHLLSHLDVVSNDQCQAARLCLRSLRARGYRRIGLATATDDESRLESTFSSGVLVEQASLPARERVPPLLFERGEIGHIAAQVEAWMRQHNVDALMTNWHELIEMSSWDGESTRLTSTSIRVPQDVAFASLDVPAGCPYIGGIVQNHRLVGMRAMEQLALMVRTFRRGAPENPSSTRVPGYWRDGATVPGKTL
ncbi:MAG TPA: LacI family DNA-binding transcriptional regulator [Opitutaceae bacterium]|nr:LacI family DNA-binding transcriptional regulator [Opitutaceae bacterium]